MLSFSRNYKYSKKKAVPQRDSLKSSFCGLSPTGGQKLFFVQLLEKPISAPPSTTPTHSTRPPYCLQHQRQPRPAHGPCTPPTAPANVRGPTHILPTGCRNPSSSTGVHEIAILRVISGHLSAFWAVFGCFAWEVSTFIAPEADFVDTCQK